MLDPFDPTYQTYLLTDLELYKIIFTMFFAGVIYICLKK